MPRHIGVFPMFFMAMIVIMSHWQCASSRIVVCNPPLRSSQEIADTCVSPNRLSTITPTFHREMEKLQFYLPHNPGYTAGQARGSSFHFDFAGHGSAGHTISVTGKPIGWTSDWVLTFYDYTTTATYREEYALGFSGTKSVDSRGSEFRIALTWWGEGPSTEIDVSSFYVTLSCTNEGEQFFNFEDNKYTCEQKCSGDWLHRIDDNCLNPGEPEQRGDITVTVQDPEGGAKKFALSDRDTSGLRRREWFKLSLQSHGGKASRLRVDTTALGIEGAGWSMSLYEESYGRSPTAISEFELYPSFSGIVWGDFGRLPAADRKGQYWFKFIWYGKEHRSTQIDLTKIVITLECGGSTEFPTEPANPRQFRPQLCGCQPPAQLTMIDAANFDCQVSPASGHSGISSTQTPLNEHATPVHRHRTFVRWNQDIMGNQDIEDEEILRHELRELREEVGRLRGSHSRIGGLRQELQNAQKAHESSQKVALEKMTNKLEESFKSLTETMHTLVASISVGMKEHQKRLDEVQRRQETIEKAFQLAGIQKKSPDEDHNNGIGNAVTHGFMWGLTQSAVMIALLVLIVLLVSLTIDVYYKLKFPTRQQSFGRPSEQKQHYT